MLIREYAEFSLVLAMISVLIPLRFLLDDAKQKLLFSFSRLITLYS